MPAARLSKRRSLSEHDEQCAVIEWCHWHAARYPALGWIFAVPNGAKLPYTRARGGGRYAPQALKLKAEGLLPGVSDLFLPVACNGFHGLFIEMKVGRNTLTAEQIDFLRYVNAAGYAGEVCYGAERAIKVIADYVGVPESERW